VDQIIAAVVITTIPVMFDENTLTWAIDRANARGGRIGHRTVHLLQIRQHMPEIATAHIGIAVIIIMREQVEITVPC